MSNMVINLQTCSVKKRTQKEWVSRDALRCVCVSCRMWLHKRYGTLKRRKSSGKNANELIERESERLREKKQTEMNVIMGHK